MQNLYLSFPQFVIKSFYLWKLKSFLFNLKVLIRTAENIVDYCQHCFTLLNTFKLRTMHVVRHGISTVRIAR